MVPTLIKQRIMGWAILCLMLLALIVSGWNIKEHFSKIALTLQITGHFKTPSEDGTVEFYIMGIDKEKQTYIIGVDENQFNALKILTNKYYTFYATQTKIDRWKSPGTKKTNIITPSFVVLAGVFIFAIYFLSSYNITYILFGYKHDKYL